VIPADSDNRDSSALRIKDLGTGRRTRSCAPPFSFKYTVVKSKIVNWYDIGMRKLIMWNLITLDGFFEGEKPWDLSFHGLVYDEELEDFTIKQLQAAGAVIYGENTYKGMADYWTAPDQAGDIKTEPINTMQKYVCSPTLETADWQNTTIIKDALAEIPKLKQEGDGNLFVFGSAILSESLMKADLFDEYRLCLVPVFLGKGRRLFNDGLPYQKLKMLKSQPLKSGAIILTYAPN